MSNNTITETITDSITGAQAKAFDLLADSQETAVKALDSWTEFLTAQTKSFVPSSFSEAFEGFGVDMPDFGQVYETLPSPTEMIDKSFAMVEDMLAKQREFAIKLAASAEEMVPAAPAAKTTKTAKK